MRITTYTNVARYTAYPFQEDTSRTGEAPGNVTTDFPLDVFTDIQFYTFIDDPESLRLQLLNPVIGSSRELIFLFTGKTMTYSIPVQVVYGTAEGTVIEAAQPGVYTMLIQTGSGLDKLFDSSIAADTFTFPEMYVEPSLIRSENKHYVNSVAGSNLTALTGDILFQEGYNIGISTVPSQRILRLTAAQGSGKGQACEPMYDDNCCDDCSDEPVAGSNCRNYLYRINGLHPDWYGNFILRGGPGIKISSPGGNIVDIESTVTQDAPECRENE